jgi:hypothetical protein
MTLTMAWVRKANTVEELVVASDSRLRAGYAWDAAPKLLILPRRDAVIGFAGVTDFAYPMLLQAWNSVASWGRSLERSQPLPDMKGHLLRVFNGMLSEVSDLPKFSTSVTPDAIFLLAGYSWSEQRFRIWTLHFDGSIRRFTFRPASPWRGGSNRGKVLALVGDGLDEARARLVRKLRDRKKLARGSFDLEPLEVLSEMVEDTAFPTIGGSVQMVKVYKSSNAAAFAITNPRTGQRSLMGRSLLPYEIPDRHPSFTLPSDQLTRDS